MIAGWLVSIRRFLTWRRRPPESYTHPVPVAFLLRLCQQPGTRHVLIRTADHGATLRFTPSPETADEALRTCLRQDLRPEEWPSGWRA